MHRRAARVCVCARLSRFPTVFSLSFRGQRLNEPRKCESVFFFAAGVAVIVVFVHVWPIRPFHAACSALTLGSNIIKNINQQQQLVHSQAFYLILLEYLRKTNRNTASVVYVCMFVCLARVN